MIPSDLKTPFTIAAISDIHSNVGAVDALLADIDKRGVDQIVDLGGI